MILKLYSVLGPVIDANIEITLVETDSFSVVWKDLSVEDRTPAIDITSSDGTKINCKMLLNIGCNAEGLQPGTRYQISFKVIDKYGVPSHPWNDSLYTGKQTVRFIGNKMILSFFSNYMLLC